MTNNLLPIEHEMSAIVGTRRIRISEFFKDFDRLRSGRISTFQFTRCLNQVLGSARSDGMTPAEEEALMAKYIDSDNMIDYKVFTNNIEQVFNADNLVQAPGNQLPDTKEYLELDPVQLTDEKIKRVQQLVKDLDRFYEYRGIDIRQCFEDFAKHNNGLITASQFLRSFPRPETVTQDDVLLLATYYSDPLKQQLVNYLKFYLDIEKERKVRSDEKTEEFLDSTAKTTDDDLMSQLLNSMTVQESVSKALQSNLPRVEKMDKRMQNLFDRVHVAIFKNRIRSTEFFRDHDKLRSGIITRNQFIRGLTLAQDGVQLGASLLTVDEINSVADYYSDNNGMVHYKEFCYKLENTFNIPDLEKKPTLQPVRPDPKMLQTKLASLNDADELRVQELIEEIREYVSKRRIMLYPYFKDFDRGAGYTRSVTKGQFARILNFSSIKLSPRDLDLVYRKYVDPITGDVLYPAFSVAVESEFSSYMKTQEDIERYGVKKNMLYDNEDVAAEGQTSETLPQKCHRSSTKEEDNSISTCLAGITEFLYKNRIRGEEFFQDFDPLRSGFVTKAIYLRCLDAMGITRITVQEAKRLADYYQDSNKTDCVRWKQFLQDVQNTNASIENFSHVYGLPDEQTPPTAPIKGKNVVYIPEEEACIARVLGRFQKRISQRRLLPKPVFQDFDQHNHGYVTAAQFRQVLCTLQLNCSEEEARLLLKRFSDNMGFNYTELLNTINPATAEKSKYECQLSELQSIGDRTTMQASGLESERYTDARSNITRKNKLMTAITRLKTLVFKERIRVYEWMKDYDKLRSGSIPRNSFRRAFDLVGVGAVLIEPEITLIMDHYTNQENPDHVQYLKLCKELEGVFTDADLEKNPLKTVVQFKPPVEWERNDLEGQEEAIFKMAMQRLGEHIRKTRIQLHPLFEDYDRVHNATVSRSQFHRVLSELEMGGLLSEQEFRVIFKKFNMTRGGKNDVNYIAFCDSFNTDNTEDFFAK